MLKNFIFTICILVGLSFMTACATMDQSECQVANWEMIGLEDGAAGRPTSYIGQHRIACAEHAITPDLDLYMKGHARGLVQYCTYQNGFNLAEHGRSLSSVCSNINAREFNRGYKRGKQLYVTQSEINQLRSTIADHHQDLKQIEKDIKSKEDIIVAGQTSDIQRRLLLEEIKSLNAETDGVEYELSALESNLFRAEERYNQLNRH
jgi:hypothetical protein